MSSSVIRFDCPACGRRLRASAGVVGRRTRCPKCERPLTVPTADRSDDADTHPHMPALRRPDDPPAGDAG